MHKKDTARARSRLPGHVAWPAFALTRSRARAASRMDPGVPASTIPIWRISLRPRRRAVPSPALGRATLRRPGRPRAVARRPTPAATMPRRRGGGGGTPSPLGGRWERGCGTPGRGAACDYARLSASAHRRRRASRKRRAVRCGGSVRPRGTDGRPSPLTALQPTLRPTGHPKVAASSRVGLRLGACVSLARAAAKPFPSSTAAGGLQCGQHEMGETAPPTLRGNGNRLGA